jgi:thymidine kinase
MVFIAHFGNMGAGKTGTLIKLVGQLKQEGKKICILVPDLYKSRKPLIEQLPENSLQSRNGSWEIINHFIAPNENLQEWANETDVNVLLIDEIQFLKVDQIYQLKLISEEKDVYTFGLRCDYQLKLYPSSQACFLLCTQMVIINRYCVDCIERDSIVDSLKYAPFKKGHPDLVNGEYGPLCFYCFQNV